MTFISIWVNSMSWTWNGKEEGKSLSDFGQALAQAAQGILKGFNRCVDVAAGDSGGPGSAEEHGFHGLRGLFPPKQLHDCHS